MTRAERNRQWMERPGNRRKRKLYHRRYAAKRYHERRAGLIQILGGKCDRCGTTEELEVHHDSGTTPLRITQLLVGYSIGRICAMLRNAGATLMCDDCHNGKTHETWIENRAREAEEFEHSDQVVEGVPF